MSQNVSIDVSAVGLVALHCLLAGCGSQDEAPAAEDGPRPTSGVPEPIAPSVPGFLDFGPHGLELVPGETARLYARYYDASGNLEEEDIAVDIDVLEDEGDLEVEGLEVRAVDVGYVQVRARYRGHEEILLVVVTEEPSSRPKAIDFDRPTYTLTLGERMPFVARILDARGKESTASTGLRLRIEGTEAVVLEGDELVATGAGIGRLVGFVDDGEEGEVQLAGEAVVAALDPQTTAIDCEQVPWQTSCGAVGHPIRFFSPGLTAPPLRVSVFQGRGCGGNTEFRRFQAAPTRVEIADGRVLGLAGSLVSRAPGGSGYSTFYGEANCGCEVAHVLPDLRGSWSARCKGGERGTLTNHGWPSDRIERTRAAWGGSSFPHDLEWPKGESCFSHDRDGFNCESSGYLRAGWPRFANLLCAEDAFLCSEDQARCRATVTTCAEERTDPGESFSSDLAFVHGPDEFRDGTCTFRRAGEPICGETEAESGTGTITLDGTTEQAWVGAQEWRNGVLELHFYKSETFDPSPIVLRISDEGHGENQYAGVGSYIGHVTDYWHTNEFIEGTSVCTPCSYCDVTVNVESDQPLRGSFTASCLHPPDVSWPLACFGRETPECRCEYEKTLYKEFSGTFDVPILE